MGTLKKKAIAAIEVLADQVDRTKSRLDALLAAPNATDTAADIEAGVVEKVGKMKLKVELDGDIRRNDLMTKNEPPTLQEIRNLIGRLYRLDPRSASRLSLKFRDTTGMMHDLADETLAKALSVARQTRMLRLSASRL